MGGLTNFNRYYFAQIDKQGAVIDERFNSGGQAADYIIHAMQRTLMSWWAPRYGAIYRTPQASILGPKVMITNEFAGSGGDAMPWYFREAQLGPLVGKRTWGGLVGIGSIPVLMDGGRVTSPSFGFFNPQGQWDVENHGVQPDYEVDMDPKPVSEGHDPQLEKAVSLSRNRISRSIRITTVTARNNSRVLDCYCRAALKGRTSSVQCKFGVLNDRKTVSSCT
jgi:tricorn protease